MAAPTLVRWYAGSSAGGLSVATSQATPAGGPAAGNLLLACVAARGSSVNQTLAGAGWNAAGTIWAFDFGGQTLLYKTATGAESAAMTFTLTVAAKASVLVLELAGAYQAPQAGPAGSHYDNPIATHQGPGGTATVEDLLLYFDHNASNDIATPLDTGGALPATGWTILTGLASTGDGAFARNRLACAYRAGLSGGYLPSLTWTGAVAGTSQRVAASSTPPPLPALAAPAVRGPLARS